MGIKRRLNRRASRRSYRTEDYDLNWNEIDREMRSTRRDLHKYPEAAWTEFRTSAIIAERLSSLGLKPMTGTDVIDVSSVMGRPDEAEIDRHIARAREQGAPAEWLDRIGRYTGVVADIETGRPGPTVALRFDIDCVDVDEEKGGAHRPAHDGFASVNTNAAHACGHDAHTAIGLGTARALVSMKDKLNGRIRLIFQPGEEGCRGAYAMMKKGVVDCADYFIAMHIGMGARTGLLGLSCIGFLATTKFNVRFKGVPAHAAGASHIGRNALLSAAAATLGLHSIAPHADGSTRINVGILNAGTGRNVIPAEAVMKAETRGCTSAAAEYMYARAVEVINGAAAMYGTKAEIVKAGETITMKSDEKLIRLIGDAVRRAGIFAEVQDSVNVGGSEDAAWLMKRVQDRGGQAVYMALGSAIAAPHHNSCFDIDEDAMLPGVRALTAAAEALGRQR